jgi:hypothetical protein
MPDYYINTRPGLYAPDNFHSGNGQVLAQDLYSDRPAQHGFNFLRQGVVEDGSAPGLISSNGQNWKDMRRFTLQTLRFEKIHFRQGFFGWASLIRNERE